MLTENRSENERKLWAQIEELSAEIEADRKACADRPAVEHRRLIVVGYRAELHARQTAWDAQNPGLVLRWHGIAAKEQALEKLRGEAFELQAKRETRERALKVLEDSPRIKARVEAGLDETESTAVFEEWEASPRLWCLLLMGGVGCGKSTAAGDHAYRQALQVAGWVSEMPIWVRAVEASRLSGFGEDAEARFKAWRSCSLLVIDDMGTEMLTPTWQQALDDILDYRYQHSLRTVLPSNLTAVEFKARYGARISDRIREEGMIREVAGKSMRVARVVADRVPS